LLPKPFIATSRFLLQYLAKSDFFVGDYSLADIALFAYTHVSHEGGFPLDDFPKIRAWIERVKAQEGFNSMIRGWISSV
jgi:glutathione S-transferase